MQENDASDDTLLRRANNGALRIAQHLSRNRSVSKSGDTGNDLSPELDDAINALEGLCAILSKEPGS